MWVRATAIAAGAALAAPLPPLPHVAPLPQLAAHGVAVVGQTAVDRQPGSPAVGFGSVWVPSSASGIVDRVDPATGKLVVRIRSVAATTAVQSQFFDSIAFTATAVWHASDAGGVVVRIDPRRNRVVTRIPVPGRPGEVAASANSVYLSLFNDTRVLRIDARTNRIVRRADIGGAAMGVAFGAGAVWALSANGPTVLRLDPVTLAVKRRIPIRSTAPEGVGFSPAWWIAADRDSVCAGGYRQNVVTRIDARTSSRAEQLVLPFGTRPFGVAPAAGTCWAVNDAGVFRGADAWSRLPALGPSAFVGIATGEGSTWVTSAGRNALLRVR